MNAPSLSLLAIPVLFLLPFMEFTCQKQSVFVFNGYEAAFGAEVEPPKLFGDKPPRKERFPSSPVLIGALLAAVVGGVWARSVPKAGAIFGLTAALLLVFFQVQVQQDARSQGKGVLGVSFLVGYWGSLIAAAGGAVTGLGLPVGPRAPAGGPVPPRESA